MSSGVMTRPFRLVTTRSHPEVARAMRGDRIAFAKLWEENAPALQGILRSMVDRQEAGDLLQEVALRAWRGVAEIREPGSFSPWLHTIARNVGRGWLAARPESSGVNLNEAVDEDLATDRGGPGERSGAGEIIDAIGRLPSAYREPLTLRLVHELTGPEISRRTGLTPGSVRVNLCRGMKMLRDRLDMNDEDGRGKRDNGAVGSRSGGLAGGVFPSRCKH